MNSTKLPRHLRSLVESELETGDRITWMEQPIPSRMARRTLPFVLFGIPWTAFALFWTVSEAWGISKIDSEPGFFRAFSLFWLPFVLVGLGMLSSPYWASRKARRSAYVLTDRRAILFNASWRGSVTVRSFEPQRLTDLRRKQHADGSGDLIFDRDIRRDGDGDRHFTDVGFLAIREVKSVEKLVRALAKESADDVA